MIIYASIIIYIMILGIITRKFQCNKSDLNTDSGYSWLTASLFMILPVFFVGMRTGFADTQAYIYGYELLDTNISNIISELQDSKGALFVIYEWIIKKYISSNFTIFFIITALIQAGAVIKFYRKHSVDYVFSVSLFFMSCMFFYMLNGMRQFLAVTIILYFADYIFEKKYAKFIIIVILSSFIHVSALIWIPAVFIVQGEPFNFKVIFMILLVVIAVNYVTGFTNLLEDSLEGTVYAGITEQFENDDGSNIIHTLIAAVPVVLSLLGKGNLRKVDNAKVNILVNIAVFGMAISLLANFTSGILVGRMPIYFTIFNYALLPYLIDQLFERQSARVVRLMCNIFYLGYMMYYFTAQGVYYVSSVLGIDTRL